MKKMFSCMLLLLISMTLLLPVYAAFENPPIIDDAGYLMQSELANLSEELEQIREKYNFEVAIYTESEMSGNTAEEAADFIKSNQNTAICCKVTEYNHCQTHNYSNQTHLPIQNPEHYDIQCPSKFR